MLRSVQRSAPSKICCPPLHIPTHDAPAHLWPRPCPTQHALSSTPQLYPCRPNTHRHMTTHPVHTQTPSACRRPPTVCTSQPQRAAHPLHATAADLSVPLLPPSLCCHHTGACSCWWIQLTFVFKLRSNVNRMLFEPEHHVSFKVLENCRMEWMVRFGICKFRVLN